MQIDKYHVIVGFTPSSVKALAGYVLKGKPEVLNMVEVVLPGLLEQGRIVDQKKAISCVKDALEQVSKSLNSTIGSVGVLTPSFAPVIKPVKVESATVGQTISKTDVKNCVNLIVKNVKLEERGVLLDVIPFGYELDENKGFNLGLPYGKEAERISLYASKVFEKTSLTNEFKEVLKKAGYSVDFSEVSPYAIGTYFQRNLQGLEEGLILSLEEKETLFAFIRKGVILSVGQAPFGYGEAYESIQSTFSLPYEATKKYLSLFGLLGGEPEGFKTQEGIGLEAFRETAKMAFTAYLDKVKEFLLKTFSSLPAILLSGSGSLVQGLPQLAANQFKTSLSIGKVSSFGARERRYSDVLGGLLLAEMHSFNGQGDSQTRLLARREESLNRGA